MRARDPRILAVIPARYSSTRFPGKPLARIQNKPMVQWVVEATQQCRVFDEVVVATDDQSIQIAVRNIPARCEMTSSEHLTGTDRVAEVARRRPGYDVVVNVQGDQPFVTAAMLEALVQPYLDGDSPEMTTLACPLDAEDARQDANTVKVACDQQMNALYFSRSPIPYYRQRVAAPVYHHLGLYAYRMDFLAAFSELGPTPLEQCEQLEQLRVLEYGFRIRVGLTASAVLEINTPDELERAQQMLARP